MNTMQVLNQTTTMSSREIAELTGKEHSHVCRDVRVMLEKLSKLDHANLDHEQNHGVTKELDERKYVKLYHLDREATYTLISGYDIVLRMKIIKRWMELEDKHYQEITVPKNYLAALKALVASEEAKEALLAKTKELENTLALDKPYTDLAKAITGQATMTRRDWLALMKDDSGVNVKERELTQFLIDQKYCYKDQLTKELRAYAQYSHFFKLEVELINGFPRTLLKVTGDGVLILTPLIVQEFSAD